MPRKFFKKISPDPKKIKENRFLSIFGDWLHEPQLWHLNRYSASVAIAIGLFCAFIPVPFQMVIAAALAIALSANLPLSVATCWVTNPLTIPPMFYFAYKVGAWTLGTPESPFAFELSMEWLESELGLIWKPFLLGCLICATASAVLGYFTIKMAWRYHVVMAWRARKERWKETIIEKLHIGDEPEAEAALEKLYGAMQYDDGTLGDIELSNLSSEEVIAGFNSLKASAKDLQTPEFFYWSKQQQKEVPITFEQSTDAIKALVEGEAEPFRVNFTSLSSSKGQKLPELGVFVFHNSLTIDYKMGAEWDKASITGLFDLLSDISEKFSQPKLDHKGNINDPEGKLFLNYWQLHQTNS